MTLHTHGHVQNQILAMLDLFRSRRGFRSQGAWEIEAYESSYEDETYVQRENLP
jgi:hypothetical protein